MKEGSNESLVFFYFGMSVRKKQSETLTRLGIKEKYRWMKAEDMEVTAESVKQTFLGEDVAQKGKQLFDLLDYFAKI